MNGRHLGKRGLAGALVVFVLLQCLGLYVVMQETSSAAQQLENAVLAASAYESKANCKGVAEQVKACGDCGAGCRVHFPAASMPCNLRITGASKSIAEKQTNLYN